MVGQRCFKKCNQLQKSSKMCLLSICMFPTIWWHFWLRIAGKQSDIANDPQMDPPVYMITRFYLIPWYMNVFLQYLLDIFSTRGKSISTESLTVD